VNKVNDYTPQPIDNRQKVRQYRANNTTSFSRYSILHCTNTRTFCHITSPQFQRKRKSHSTPKRGYYSTI